MSETAIAADDDLPQPDLATLRDNCLAEMERFRQERVNDPTPCLSLFRKAILHRDPDAWEALVEVYQPYIRRWIRRHGLASDTNLVDELAQEAVVRFWRAYSPEQFARAHFLADILRYWQDCATSAGCDWLRRDRNTPDSLDETGDGSLPKDPVPDALARGLIRAEARDRLWRIVHEQCQGEADRILGHCIFVEGQKPGDVLREYSDYFESIEQVYKRLRNLKDRLRRTPGLLELLETCC